MHQKLVPDPFIILNKKLNNPIFNQYSTDLTNNVSKMYRLVSVKYRLKIMKVKI